MEDDLVHVVEVKSKGVCAVHPDRWRSSLTPISGAICVCRELRISKFAYQAVSILTEIVNTTSDDTSKNRAREFLVEHGSVI